MFQISFLHASLLIFAAATILPLVIWLIAKRKPPRVVFGSLRFIKISKEQEKKRSRLKDIILLIIRMLIILLIALAVARPQVYSPRFKKSGKHPPTAIAIVIDSSMSMDYLHESKTLLDRAKEAVMRIGLLCTDADKSVIITLDETWNTLHGQTFAGAPPADLPASIGITHTPVSMEAALKLAQTKLVESGLPNREMYLLTAGKSSVYPASFDMPVYLIPLDTPATWENLSVKDLQPLPQLVDKTRVQSLGFTLVNHGAQDRQDVLVRAILGETKVAEKIVSIPARQELKENILLELRNDGWQTGYVEVVDERLLHDNRAYFAFPHRINPSIAVISQSASLPFYLEGALRVYAGTSGKIKIVNPAQLTHSDLQLYQNFVVYNPGSLNPRLKELMESLRNDGRGALVILDEGMGTELKTWWGSIFEAKIGAFERQGKELNKLNPHHYISALLSGKDLAQKTCSHYWNCQANGSVALASAGSSDLILAKDRMVLFAFDPAATQNSFFIGPIFPVLAYRALEHSGLAQASGSKIRLGELIVADKLTLPDGSNLELAGRSLRASQPGIYISQKGSSEPLAMAVDYDYDQSGDNPQDFATLKYIKALGKDWQRQIFGSRLGYDIWKILIAIALALFLLEIIIVKLSESKSGMPGKEEEYHVTEH